MGGGCEECQMCRSALNVYRCDLEASVRRANHVNSSVAWGEVASLQTQVRQIKSQWARHLHGAHGYPNLA